MRPSRAPTVESIREALRASSPPVACGADFGFSRNASAVACAVREGEAVRLLAWREWIPGRAALVPSVVFRDAATFAREHRADAIHTDAHYREAAREAFGAVGIALRPAPVAPSVAFLEVRRLLVEGRVRGLGSDRVRAQLEEVRAEEGERGHVRIVLPTWADGTHGDVASAVVLALYEASRGGAYAPPIGARLARG